MKKIWYQDISGNAYYYRKMECPYCGFSTEYWETKDGKLILYNEGQVHHCYPLFEGLLYEH